MDKELNRKMISWIGSNNTGRSSITVWTAIMNVENYSPSVPYDVYDFQRCYNLLKLCDDEMKTVALDRLNTQHQIWRPLISRWEELVKMYEQGSIIEFNKLLKELTKR